jgi:uncharacterized membrane protein YtjA (UPF0391 family)
MKNAALSVLIVLGLGAVVVATLSMFKVTEEAAKPFAGILPLAIPAVHQLLQQSGSHLSLSPRKRGLVDRRGYALPLWMLALYGVLIVLAVFELMSGLTGIAGTSAGLAKEKLAYVGTPGLIPTMMVAYLVGRWIGVRSQTKGLFVVLAVAFFVPFIDRVLALAFMSREDLSAYFHSTNTTELLLVAIVEMGVLIGVPAIFGYWRGRVVQLSRYLGYLVRALPEESQEALVDLASDEAKRLASNSASQSGTSPT